MDVWALPGGFVGAQDSSLVDKLNQELLEELPEGVSAFSVDGADYCGII